LENVRVRRAGFAYRMPYPRFLQRYKCISPVTWPNFRGGGPKDGVSVILKHMRVMDDAVFGKTKIFIRTPRTIFELEEARSACLPRLVTFLQKNWRGALARRRVKQMRAVYRIMDCYRRYKFRSYLLLIINRFKNVRQLPDLGKSLTWPPGPAVLRPFVNRLKSIHERWRASVILSRIPKDQWNEMKQKVYAAEALRGRRSEWGFQRRWHNDYLALPQENPSAATYKTALAHLRHPFGFTTILFSSYITKFNKHNKSAQRALVVTDKNLIKFYGTGKQAFKPMGPAYDLSSLKEISISSGRDALVVLHLDNANDMVFHLMQPPHEDRVGELVGVLVMYFEKRFQRRLQVNVGATDLHCHLGAKPRTVRVELSAQVPSPSFKHQGHMIQLVWPTAA